MSDEPFYKPRRTPVPPRQPRVGELLLEFDHDGRRFRCELFEHGETAVEARFTIVGGEFLISRRFDMRMDPTRTPRALAVQWAEEERKAMERRA